MLTGGQHRFLVGPESNTYTTNVLKDMAKMTMPLYHVGQLRGLFGSSSSQSTSNEGSRVIALSMGVTLVDRGGRDIREIWGVTVCDRALGTPYCASAFSEMEGDGDVSVEES